MTDPVANTPTPTACPTTPPVCPEPSTPTSGGHDDNLAPNNPSAGSNEGIGPSTGDGSSVFDNLTNETSYYAKQIAGNTKDDGKSPKGLYDEDGLINPDLEILQSIYLEDEENSGLTLITQEDGSTEAWIDEDGDGTYDRTAIFDKDGNKTAEIIDRNNDGTREAEFKFDENGKVDHAKIDTDMNGEADIEEAYENIDGKDVNTVAKYDENGKIDGITEYTNKAITAIRRDNNDDGFFETGTDFIKGEFSSDFGKELESYLEDENNQEKTKEAQEKENRKPIDERHPKIS